MRRLNGVNDEGTNEHRTYPVGLPPAALRTETAVMITNNRTTRRTGAQTRVLRGLRNLVRWSAAGFMALLFIIAAGASEAVAQVTTADFVEWDLPSLQGAGTCPSAIGAVTLPPTGDPVYYVTRCPAASPNNLGRMGPALVRFVPGIPLETAVANWRTWNLGDIPDVLPGPTGGMKITADETVAFIRASREIIRVNMTTNALTRWADPFIEGDPVSASDLALVERKVGSDRYIDIYTTQDDVTNQGIVQRLTVKNGSNTATLTQWAVDGGAGEEFLSGVAHFQGKVYFSESFTAQIGELNPATNRVRRWSLLPVGASIPRQIATDTKGIIWVVTGSGHLVSLNPQTNDMASYIIPGAGAPPSPGASANPFGIATSGGVVAFTESEGKKTGLLIPNKTPVNVPPSDLPADFVTSPLTGTPDSVVPDTGQVAPDNKAGQPAVHTDLDPFGEFIEATLPDTGNFPFGIFRNVERAVGNFYLVVMLNGTTEHRLSHVSFPVSEVASAGLVTGGGTIDAADPLTAPSASGDPDRDAWAADGGKANFGLNVFRKTVGGAVRGNLNYVNKITGDKVKSVQILTFSISGNTATFSGSCTNNGQPCTFTCTVQDNGNPGRGRDTFSLDGAGFTPNSDTLNGGNIKIHNKP